MSLRQANMNHDFQTKAQIARAYQLIKKWACLDQVSAYAEWEEAQENQSHVWPVKHEKEGKHNWWRCKIYNFLERNPR